MSDAKPYTLNDINRYEVIPTEFRSYISGQRLIATVEALERVTRERDSLDSYLDAIASIPEVDAAEGGCDDAVRNAIATLKAEVERLTNLAGQNEEWAEEARARAIKAEAESERLRGLIKQAEWANEDQYPEGRCPWCGNVRELHRYGNGVPVPATGCHRNTCPAFTPSGEVR